MQRGNTHCFISIALVELNSIRRDTQLKCSAIEATARSCFMLAYNCQVSLQVVL